MLELHSDAYAWWVLPAGRLRRAAELRRGRRGARPGRAGGQGPAGRRTAGPSSRRSGHARLVITNAVSVDRRPRQIELTHPLSVVVTEPAADLPGRATRRRSARPTLLTRTQDARRRRGRGRPAADRLTAVVNTYENAVQWLEDPATGSPTRCSRTAAEPGGAAAGVPAADGAVPAPPADRADAGSADRPGRAAAAARSRRDQRTASAPPLDHARGAPRPGGQRRPTRSARRWPAIVRHQPGARRPADERDR